MAFEHDPVKKNRKVKRDEIIKLSDSPTTAEASSPSRFHPGKGCNRGTLYKEKSRPLCLSENHASVKRFCRGSRKVKNGCGKRERAEQGNKIFHLS